MYDITWETCRRRRRGRCIFRCASFRINLGLEPRPGAFLSCLFLIGGGCLSSDRRLHHDRLVCTDDLPFQQDRAATNNTKNKFSFARRRGDVFAVRCNSIFRFKYEYPGAARPPGKMRLENRRRPLPPVCFYFEICIFNCGKESTARNPLYSGKSGEKGTNLIFL
jgi:hypothetical protein